MEKNMISLRIKDIKIFMSHLLIKDTFDDLLLSEANITTGNTFTINGYINKSFYTDEELANMTQTDYTSWGKIKPFCFSLIKGNKVPTSMKIVFVMSKAATVSFVGEYSKDMDGILAADNINGLYINILYSDGTATITTGTSLNIFTLDKTTEKCFDKHICSFLEQSNIDFDIIY